MRIVVKVGTYLVMQEDTKLNRVFLENLATQIASLISEGHEIVLVSSGAVAAGRSEVRFKNETKNLPHRQVLAAVGQSVLVDTYRHFFKQFKIPVAQALLTNFDFTNREHFFNTRVVFEEMLKNNIVPIVNENDVTTLNELKFGDNDMLAAKSAAMISADILILLTTVDGLFTDNPEKNPNAELINIVENFDKSIWECASKETKPGSMGGMFSKIKAAEYAVSSGISTFVGGGQKTNIIRQTVDWFKKKPLNKDTCSVPATFFPAKQTGIKNAKKWMKPKIVPGAEIIVDDGCKKALLDKGKSLLPGGIADVNGEFSRGDVVQIVDQDATVLGYGQVNYDYEELSRIKGKKTSEVEAILGYSYQEEIIHRDRAVILGF